jgi:hypothetical protein
MFHIPFCAYWVQILTTVLESSISASVLSNFMFFLINSTARYAPVVTACIEAPANQKITAPPQIRPRMIGASVSCTCSMFLLWRSRMIEKIIVVAPHTAVPMSTGLAVALKVFPAPSLDSR